MKTIKEARIAIGWSQQRVSDELLIPIRTIQDWENDRRTPPEYVEAMIVDKLERIAASNEGDLLEFINHKAGADELMSLKVAIDKKLKSSGTMRGFEKLLDTYDVHDYVRENKLMFIISALEFKGVKVNQFTFERFEQEKHDDVEKDVLVALDNAIDVLQKSLDNLENGNGVSPE